MHVQLIDGTKYFTKQLTFGTHATLGQTVEFTTSTQISMCIPVTQVKIITV